jgi:hypothetical protein
LVWPIEPPALTCPIGFPKNVAKAGRLVAIYFINDYPPALFIRTKVLRVLSG